MKQKRHRKKSNMNEMNEIQQQARHQYLAMAMEAIHNSHQINVQDETEFYISE